MQDSKCIIKNEEKLYLYELLGNEELATFLIYRGSDHGWKHKHFYSQCSDKGPTITLFKIRNGDTIGAYTTCMWSLDGSKISKNDETMLFNLT